VEFRILGPLEITVGTERLELGGTRQQIVVATLLLSANKVVTMDRLLEAIYGEDLPPTARAQAQISISSLRRTFAAYSPEPVIATHAHGYVIQVQNGRLDAERFEGLFAAARAAREGNSVDLAVARYRDALRLWRGPALDGIDSSLLRAAAHRLDEQRIATNEDRLTLELDLGRHHELVGELTDLIREYPVRERLRGQLMLALYRCDRADEALEVYEQARRTMIDELGIEPGEHLQRLAHAIATADPALDLPAAPVTIAPVSVQVPGLLPTDIADFTGRAEQLGRIRSHLVSPAEDKARGAVPVVVIVGKGGIGKTSLAVRASHEIAGHFPDGQLFADLHGAASRPVGPMQVLERFLRAFGVPGSQIPEGLDERAEVYRNLLADRKVLVVLDDAATESQVSPLLPGTPGAAVIISSRSRLAGLPGAIHVEMNVFDADRSLDLLVHIVGAERVKAEPDAAAEVAGHCGHLPLALRIAGARLAARPHWRIQQLADRLADETRRLDELRHGDMGIRPSISLTYESTSEHARQLFRRLALLDLPVFSGWLGSVLIDQPLADAEDLLDDLVSAQLVEITSNGSGVHSQYHFHDLIRVFARERLAVEESAAERRAALQRALGALLYVADRADRQFFGGDDFGMSSDAPRWPLPERLVQQLVSDPLAWYERERTALVWAVRQAAQAGFTELCWSLAFKAVTLFEARSYLDDWRETHEIALEAAKKADNLRGQAAMLFSIGSMHVRQERFGPAHAELTAAAQLFRDAGDRQGVAHVTRFMADLDRFSGRLDDAARGYERALAVLRESGGNVAVACVLRDLAQVRLEFQRFDEAMELLSEALQLTRAARCARIEAQVLHRIGDAWLQSGEPANAIVAFDQALSTALDIGDIRYESYALRGVGIARVRLGEFGQAREALQRALELAGSIDERSARSRALLGLSELALASGDPGEAILFGQRAARAFREMRMPLLEARALTLLSDSYATLGDAAAAAAASADAVALRAKVLGHQQVSSPVTAGDLD
jgi:DNA-binding SARP family transcriptional activator/predicted negative regulator of RcsB-dependent stress response